MRSYDFPSNNQARRLRYSLRHLESKLRNVDCANDPGDASIAGRH